MSAVQEKRGTLASRVRGLRRLLGKRTGFAGFVFALMVLAAFSEMIGVSMVLPIISSVAGVPAGLGRLGQAVETLRTWLPNGWEIESLIGILAVAFLLKAVLMVTTHTLTEYFALTLRNDWTERMFAHYLSVPFGTLVRSKQGTLVHNLTVEPYRAGRGIEFFLNLVNRGVMTTVLVAMLLFISWEATLAVALVGGGLLYLMRRWTYKYALHFGEEYQRFYQEASALGAESIAGGVEIRLFGAMDRINKQIAELLRHHTRAETLFRAMKELPIQGTEFLVVVMLAAPVLVLTTFMGINPATYAATLAFFLIVSQRLLTNLGGLLALRMKLVSHMPSLRLIDEVLRNASEREDTETGATFTGPDGDIVLRDVSFGYEPGRDVLRRVSMTIPRGATTALLGPSGIGKSTIADLLLGLIHPREGKVMLGTRDLREFSLSSLRTQVGYVSQHPVIFNATVRENLRFGAPNATDAELVAAARMARADSFISRLPKGYDTQLGDRGASLSGGERQRLAIARVIVRRPSIYVFDEATSALDPESETLVRDAIRSLAADATVLVIAHRPSAMAGADVVYRLSPEGMRQVGHPGAGLAGVGT